MGSYNDDKATQMSDDSNRQAGALTEIEVTPAMIEAGVAVLKRWFNEPGSPEEWHREAVEAVLAASLCRSERGSPA